MVSLPFRPRHPVVPVIRMTGMITASGSPLGRSLNLAGVAGALERAFSVKRAPAVAILINSPGGSPVQSALIGQRIRDLSEDKGKPVLAFVEDVAASGGYWIAAAADEIYADRVSIIGSIGVVTAGFGFTGLIDKLGVERRVHTAGEKKVILDPFRPEREEDVGKLDAVLADMHTVFKDQIRARRGDRLTADEADLFTGEFWLGARALDLGLIDGIGHLRGVLRHKFGDKVRPRLIGGRRPWWQKTGIGGALRGPGIGAGSLGQGLAEGLVEALETRAAWGRFGL